MVVGRCLCHILPSTTTPTPDTQTSMSQYHRHNLNVRGGVEVVVGRQSIDMGKNIFFRFKTKGSAQDVSCADIIKIC